MRQSQECRLEEPEDEVWDEAEYRKVFGDPAANGHQRVDWGDCKGIRVPGKRVWKVKRARVLSAEIETVHDRGDFQLGPMQLESQMEDLAATFMPERATGLSLSDLQPVASPSAAAPAAPAPPAAAASSSSLGGPGLMFSFFGGLSAQQARPLAAAPAAQADQQGPVRSGGGRSGGGQGSRPGTASRRAVAPDGAPALDKQPVADKGDKGGKRGRPREDLEVLTSSICAPTRPRARPPVHAPARAPTRAPARSPDGPRTWAALACTLASVCPHARLCSPDPDLQSRSMRHYQISCMSFGRRCGGGSSLPLGRRSCPGAPPSIGTQRVKRFV